MICITARAVLLAFLISAGAAASAGATTLRRGSDAASGVIRTSESGVTVYRGAKPVLDELAGGERVSADASDAQVVIVECRRGQRYLRTQGFYSGHPGESRRFTQGFWSGPADPTRSSVKVVRVVRR